jgi:hypothetical protein
VKKLICILILILLLGCVGSEKIYKNYIVNVDGAEYNVRATYCSIYKNESWGKFSYSIRCWYGNDIIFSANSNNSILYKIKGE